MNNTQFQEIRQAIESLEVRAKANQEALDRATTELHNEKTNIQSVLNRYDDEHKRLKSEYQRIINEATIGRQVFINEAIGDDDAPGTQNEPFKTLKGALSSPWVPINVTIHLNSSINIREQATVWNRNIFIDGHDHTMQVVPTRQTIHEQTVDNVTKLRTSNCTINISRSNIQIPAISKPYPEGKPYNKWNTLAYRYFINLGMASYVGADFLQTRYSELHIGDNAEYVGHDHGYGLAEDWAGHRSLGALAANFTYTPITLHGNAVISSSIPKDYIHSNASPIETIL